MMAAQAQRAADLLPVADAVWRRQRARGTGLARHRHIVQAAALADERALSLLVAMSLTEVRSPSAIILRTSVRDTCHVERMCRKLWTVRSGVGRAEVPTNSLDVVLVVALVDSRRRL